jgi:hypothetical protein
LSANTAFSMKPTTRKGVDGKLTAPFTRDEVWSLNAYQDAQIFHPYTCPNCDILRWGSNMRLVATALGWVCRNTRENGCQYVQYWAHDWTADWRWKQDQKGVSLRRDGSTKE